MRVWTSADPAEARGALLHGVVEHVGADTAPQPFRGGEELLAKILAGVEGRPTEEGDRS